MTNDKRIFEKSFNPKCIYIFRIHDDIHKNLLKIGDATVKTDKLLNDLAPNCKELNQAAKLRIKDYTNTVGASFELLHTELAVMKTKDEEGNSIQLSFRDHRVHEVLINSGIERVEFTDSTAREWFKVDLETAKKAITAVKEGKKNLSGEQITQNFCEIQFRPEQREAIRITLDRFKTQNRMLWNAKMRFGKTLTALEVVRKSKFNKTIIITHRPVVDAGWYDDFNKIFYEEGGKYIYGSKGSGTSLKDLLNSGKKFVYFASIQDLRGSKRVGGIYEKNEDVFDLDWDFVIVDEAHEGTTTMLGDTVIKSIVKEENDYTTKFLALSGTPFNILGDFDKNIYTWDYIMEQKAKDSWDISHLEPNPYDELPKMNIFTYDIGKLQFDGRYMDIFDKSFKFTEFFRVWTGEKSKDGMSLPEGVSVGDFYHEEDVVSFLNLICAANEESQYPYSSEEYRNIFKHTLWIVPGVKEAKALSKLLKNHSVFSFFEVVNVAGDGDEEEEHDEALKKVKKAIKKAGNDGYTITLSCGKLTTGVTVPEWTAVFYLAGSFSTSASSYLQTIFRVQSPCNKYGMTKTVCYVFDFAPDRTLKMMAEAAAISTKAGGTSSDDRVIMGELLNYCPVISIDGTEMKPYNTASLLQQLKRAYAERAVRTGFDDINIYSNELLKLTEDDLSLLNDIKGIIGTSAASHNTNDIDINSQGFTEEEYEVIEKAKKKGKKERTPEEEQLLKELAEKRKQRKNAISVLRGISIRMPLLIYGADIPFEDDVSIEQLTDLVDDSSWEEFMPEGITKERFNELIKFYDPDIFVAAGRRIRNIAKSADELPPIERAQKIAELFSCFKNPDKETVLTPWRVVNIHMSKSLGGWCFFNKDYNELLDEPICIELNKTTKELFDDPESKILEINSKTGLYPLYVASSMFLYRLSHIDKNNRTLELEESIWKDIILNNIYIICKTPMAKTITQRTLVGYKKYKINAHAFDDLINQFREKSEQIVKKISRGSFWGRKEIYMNFKAAVGNPPYQEEGNNTRKSPIYHYFYDATFELANVVSLITPARFLFDAGQTPKAWNDKMLSDEHFKVIEYYPDSKEIFSTVDIKGGVAITLRDSEKDFGPIGVFTAHEEMREIIKSVKRINKKELYLDQVVSSRGLYRVTEKFTSDFPFASERLGKGTGNMIASNFFEELPEVYTTNPKNKSDYYGFLARINNKRTICFIKKEYIQINEYLPTYNVAFSKSNGSGTFGETLAATEIIEPGCGATDTFINIGCLSSVEEARNLQKYIKTKFLRAMLGVKKVTQDNPRSVWEMIPLQDFSNKSDIDWNKPITLIDQQLYKKYELTDKEVEFIEFMVTSME